MLKLTEIIRVDIAMYLRALKRAQVATMLLWKIPLVMFLLLFAFPFVANLMSNFGIVGGFVLGFVFAALITLLLPCLEAGVRAEKTGLEIIRRRFFFLFPAVLTVTFIFFIINELLNRALPVSAMNLRILLGAALTLLFNPVLESIYLATEDGINSLRHSLHFMRENWPEWLVPHLIIVAPLIWHDQLLFKVQFIQGNPITYLEVLLLDYAYLGADLNLVLRLLYSVLLCFLFFGFLVFRGALFKALDGSTRRKRIFQDRMGN
ncbi:hypothetical protein JNK13_05310 [bacterium]|nr:hypothetical protein [bacterium]